MWALKKNPQCNLECCLSVMQIVTNSYQEVSDLSTSKGFARQLPKRTALDISNARSTIQELAVPKRSLEECKDIDGYEEGEGEPKDQRESRTIKSTRCKVAPHRGRGDSTGDHAEQEESCIDSTDGTTHQSLKEESCIDSVDGTVTTHQSLKEESCIDSTDGTTHQRLKEESCIDSTDGRTTHQSLKEESCIDSTDGTVTTHQSPKEESCIYSTDDTTHQSLKEESCIDSTNGTTHQRLKEESCIDSTEDGTTHHSLKEEMASGRKVTRECHSSSEDEECLESTWL